MGHGRTKAACAGRLALLVATGSAALGSVPASASAATVIGDRVTVRCSGTVVIRWTGGPPRQTVYLQRDRGAVRAVGRTSTRRYVLRTRPGHTYRVRLGRARARVLTIVRATACPTAATWRVAWGTAIDAYYADSAWNAHPTRTSTSVADATYRFIVRPTLAGSAVRIRLSNPRRVGLGIAGNDPVGFDAVTVAPRRSGADVATPLPVTFNGSRSIRLAPGASMVSDPVHLAVRRLDDLAVSIHVPQAQANPPLHPQTRVTQFRADGDHTADTSGAAYTTKQQPIFWLDALDVLTTATRTVVAIGDSITDGDQCGGRTASGACDYSDDALMDTDASYPAFAARRLVDTGFVNVGVNGAVALQTGDVLQHDVLDQAGVTDAIVEVGTNDISFGVPASVITHNLLKVAERLRARGIRVIGATLVPRGDYAGLTGIVDFPGAAATRDRVNAFIRTSGSFDAVLDIARAVGAEGDDNRFDPAFDSGDALHPNTAGYRAIADALVLP